MTQRLGASVAERMTGEQFRQHREQEIARRTEFASLYPQIAAQIERQIASNIPDGYNQNEVIIPTVGRNDEEDEKLAEVRKVHRRMAEIHVLKATVINLCPWPIQGQGPYLMYDDTRIPACPIGTAYVRKVFETYKVDIEDKGGRFGADAITPINLASDLVKQLEPMKRGGLFCFIGDHLPGESKDEKQADRELKMLDKAKKEFLRYAKSMFREAEGFFQQPNRRGLSNIVEHHRLCCQWLLHYRYITDVPAWLTATREDLDVPDQCVECGEELGPGYSCGKCGHIVDPIGAYNHGAIDDDHYSLRNLTREQLDEIGLDYVPTKEEYRAQRRREALGEDDGEEESLPAPKRRSRPKRPVRKPAPKPAIENEPNQQET